MTQIVLPHVREVGGAPAFRRAYDFSSPLDDFWELIPDPGWMCDLAPGAARLRSTLQAPGKAEVFLRPCSIDGDTIEMGLAPGAPKAGLFVAAFISGFEHITAELDLTTGTCRIHTQEAHKRQPRFEGTVPVPARSMALRREMDRLPGLPYTGVRLTLLIDGRPAASVGGIDFLPESLFMFGLQGPGEVTLSHWSIEGPARPRPEYARVGLWQQKARDLIPDNVAGLLEGVRQAAGAGVRILVTPETSLTGLHNEQQMNDRKAIAEGLGRFQRGIAAIDGAPYTLIGYPDWVSGREVEGAEVDWVRVNRHRFVRPDGTLGPSMAKVHTCEPGFWHGRSYNLQRVEGVEVATGVCHDGHYQDVWAVGVMGGARLCLHPMAGGNLAGNIPRIVQSYRGLGSSLDSFWLKVNAGGGACIVYPTSNRKQPETLLAVPRDLTEANPTYPEYSPMGDQLAHARIRLWDATGCYPLRTLRSGKRNYELWSSLIPPMQEV